MARSTCVYVVLSGKRVLAGFTVKHELVSWLGRRATGVDGLTVWRSQDNPSSDASAPTNITEAFR